MNPRNERDASWLMEPNATESEFERWIEATMTDTRRAEKQRRGWLMPIALFLIALLGIASACLIARGCA